MNIYDEKEMKNQLRADLLRLGRAAPRYAGGESVPQLRAYLRRYCEPYLRGLKAKGVIAKFLIGISPVFFYHPKLRVFLRNGKFVELPLDGLYRLSAAGLLLPEVRA